MKDYIRTLRQRFDNGQHLATFVGVSYDTVKSWQSGRRTPAGPELRMLQLLGTIATEAPWLFQALIRPAVVKLPALLPLDVTTVTRERPSDDRAYWQEQWDTNGSSEIDNLSDAEYKRIKRLLDK